MTSNLERRIALLEAGAAVQDRANHVVHEIIVDVDEDEDAAVARFKAEHPEMDLREPAPGEHLPIGLIVRKIVAPPHGNHLSVRRQPRWFRRLCSSRLDGDSFAAIQTARKVPAASVRQEPGRSVAAAGTPDFHS